MPLGGGQTTPCTQQLLFFRGDCRQLLSMIIDIIQIVKAVLYDLHV